MRKGVAVMLAVLALIVFAPVPHVIAVDKSPYAGEVVLNEVLYRGSCGGSSSSSNDEFVELYVADNVDMCGWKVSDGNVEEGDTDGNGGFVYTFNVTDTCQFDAGDYIVIWVGPDFNMTHADDAALQVHLGKGPKLNNSGDDVWLFDNNGKLVDYMAYGTDHAINDQNTLPQGFWNSNVISDTANGQSLSLTPNGVDTDSGADWEPTTSGIAAGPMTVDTDALTCNGNDRVSSAGKTNNEPPTPTPTSTPTATSTPMPTNTPTPTPATTSTPVPIPGPVNVPEPSTILLEIGGAVLIAIYVKKSRKVWRGR